MLKRNIKITFRLNKAEQGKFKNRVKKSGLSQESYIRHLINGLIPSDAPPPDYHAMIKELHAIGNNLNQVAYKANALNVIDVQQYRENITMLNKAILNIMEAVLLPQKLPWP